MRANAASAPRQRSSSPASSAGDLGGLLLRCFARHAQLFHLLLHLFERLLRSTVLSFTAGNLFALLLDKALLGIALVFVALVLEIPLLETRSRRCTSESICRKAALWLALSRSAFAALFCLQIELLR